MAVDGSVHSDNAFNYYIDGVRMPNDKLILIHVPEDYNFTDASPGVIESLLRKIKEKSKEIEKQYTEKLKGLDVDYKFELGFGSPGEQIVRIAEKSKASMILVGSRGHGWLRRTVMGSVSSFVLHHTSIPVLVCKHFEQLEPEPSK